MMSAIVIYRSIAESAHNLIGSYEAGYSRVYRYTVADVVATQEATEEALLMVAPEITEEGTEATTEATDESGMNGAAVPEATEQSGGCQHGEDDPRLARTLKSVRMHFALERSVSLYEALSAHVLDASTGTYVSWVASSSFLLSAAALLFAFVPGEVYQELAGCHTQQ
ncbi:hypothetical protein PHYSODRAFT_341809 [Phytophthora sojae]|uniref:Uncharacterized protein n=1 Tax=Phytophthora sojae (strain P6497) TaxID=1094619 RepID=G5AEF7_PHYSP|nr:hypothetical protein PHYSODRAFT_341809 [Phytophthora sojae]EGZ06559.1 hypothetical protein PHYSODRAFT_341809 [Phytophthora sojae]|eukprot:XP_009538456.1 hypothetical protein PHYSODRAFT_341809 [Phytophthora sojae]